MRHEPNQKEEFMFFGEPEGGFLTLRGAQLSILGPPQPILSGAIAYNITALWKILNIYYSMSHADIHTPMYNSVQSHACIITARWPSNMHNLVVKNINYDGMTSWVYNKCNWLGLLL